LIRILVAPIKLKVCLEKGLVLRGMHPEVKNIQPCKRFS